MEKIEVRYKPAGVDADLNPYFHKYIVYTDGLNTTADRALRDAGLKLPSNPPGFVPGSGGDFAYPPTVASGPLPDSGDWRFNPPHQAEPDERFPPGQLDFLRVVGSGEAPVADAEDLPQMLGRTQPRSASENTHLNPDFSPRADQFRRRADGSMPPSNLEIEARRKATRLGAASQAELEAVLPLVLGGASDDDVRARLEAVREGRAPGPQSELPSTPDQSGALQRLGGNNRLARMIDHIVPTHAMIGAGAQGAPVAEIQRFLNMQGVAGADAGPLPVNGRFDDATRAAVEAYQAKHPTLLEDGIVGLRTLTAMLRDEASARRPRGAKATIAAGGANVAKPAADAAEDRALRLAHELGERLGRSYWPGGSAADIDFSFGFKPSAETGAIDPDALEVSTALRVPHSVDRGLPWASRKRDAAIIYTALRGRTDATHR